MQYNPCTIASESCVPSKSATVNACELCINAAAHKRPSAVFRWDCPVVTYIVLLLTEVVECITHRTEFCQRLQWLLAAWIGHPWRQQYEQTDDMMKQSQWHYVEMHNKLEPRRNLERNLASLTCLIHTDCIHTCRSRAGWRTNPVTWHNSQRRTGFMLLTICISSHQRNPKGWMATKQQPRLQLADRTMSSKIGVLSDVHTENNCLIQFLWNTAKPHWLLSTNMVTWLHVQTTHMWSTLRDRQKAHTWLWRKLLRNTSLNARRTQSPSHIAKCRCSCTDLCWNSWNCLQHLWHRLRYK